MGTSNTTKLVAVTQQHPVQKIELSTPFEWIKKGFQDLKMTPVPSLLYGLGFALIGLVLIFVAANNPIWSASLVATFFLVGPFLAVGLYHLSRQIEEGEDPCLLDSLSSIKENIVPLGIFVTVLGFIMMIWMRIAALVAGVYFGNVDLIAKGWTIILTNEQSIEFIAFFTLFGFFIANIAFSISLVAIPMIMHRKVDFLTAITTSLRAVVKNPLPLLVWAILIVVLIHLGFFAAFIGLAVTFPIIGHASWHAYRDLVGDKQ